METALKKLFLPRCILKQTGDVSEYFEKHTTSTSGARKKGKTGLGFRCRCLHIVVLYWFQMATASTGLRSEGIAPITTQLVEAEPPVQDLLRLLGLASLGCMRIPYLLYETHQIPLHALCVQSFQNQKKRISVILRLMH